jgi:hypothetical protein
MEPSIPFDRPSATEGQPLVAAPRTSEPAPASGHEPGLVTGRGDNSERLSAAGASSVVERRGDTVVRPGAPWTATVNALLRHLEDTGFAGAPRVVGDGVDDDGNQVLTYVEGDLVHPHAWSDEAVWRAGVLLRDLHAAVASFRPPRDAVWQPWWMHRADGPLIAHCDAAPWNTIARDGMPVAFIDWELAGPADPLDEVAICAWWHAQLHGDDVAARAGLPGPEARARQLRLFLDGYELPGAQREGLVRRMIDLAIRDCADEAGRMQVTGGSPLWPLAWRARASDWMLRHTSLLTTTITT